MEQEPTIHAPASLADLQEIPAADIARIEEVAREVSLQPADLGSSFGTALSIAERLFRLREAITPEMGRRIMALQGLPMGFRTDKDKVKDRQTGRWRRGPGYPWPIVRDCLIEAVLRGVYPWGNMFNILGGAPYITRPGFEFKLRNLPGFGRLRKNPQPPKMQQNLALITFTGSFEYGGSEDTFERTYSISSYPTDKVEMILGKAERKWLRDLWDYVTSSPIDLPDGEVGDGELQELPTAAAALPLAESLPERDVPRAERVVLPLTGGKAAPAAAREEKPQEPAGEAEPAPQSSPAQSIPTETDEEPPAWDDGSPVPEPVGPEAERWTKPAQAATISQEKLDKLRALAASQGLSEGDLVNVFTKVRTARGVGSVYELPPDAETEILREIQSAGRRRPPQRASG